MIGFNTFLNEGNVRQGVKHIYSTTTAKGNQTPSLSVDDFKNTVKGGKIHIHSVTEKTDGQAFKLGYDNSGFYTQHSGSGAEKIRNARGHIDRAKKRAKETGKPYHPTGPEAMAKFHHALHTNKKLQKHLHDEYKKHGKEVIVRGEAFNKHIAQPGRRSGEIKFAHTSYNPATMGRHGSFIIHTKLPENKHHNAELFKKHLSDQNVTFDHDAINHPKTHIDVSREEKVFNKLKHNVINARTTKNNKEHKQKETEKFNRLKKVIHSKVQRHIKQMGIKPKWGKESEGIIVHPSSVNPDATRFKLTSDTFKAVKDKSKFKR